MPETTNGYLVTRQDGGYGDSFRLEPGLRYSIGRAPDNQIVLRDDLCSRHHAEVSYVQSGWVLKDLGSLNGFHFNGTPVRGEVNLRPDDEVTLGRTVLVFVEDPARLPDHPSGHDTPTDSNHKFEITRRLGRTKYLPETAEADVSTTAPPPTAPAKVPPSEALARLYRLAVDMADVKTQTELAELTVATLLEATPAEVGAVLAVADARDMEPIVYSSRYPGKPTYHKVSRFVSKEVTSSRQAVLAENVAGTRHLKDRDSLTELKAASLICAPILVDGQLLGLLHLYSTSVAVRLGPDDLELTVAAAHQLGVVWSRVRKQAGLSVEVQTLKDQLRVESELVGRSEALRRVEEQVGRVAATRATVLVRGESGVGKELVARAIHFSSPRKDAAFVCLNCAALTETLLESELFGHEKGAFTGATDRMIGKFEAADGGTIFLDEIGEMALSTQAKFLRVLEGQPFERVGGNVPIKVDVRVVAATNRTLEEAVRAGKFRKDLYFRLQVVQIDVPPLRDRPDDVRPLAEHFLKRFARETGRKVKGFTPAAFIKMEAHTWPGNVRELRNVVERAVALGQTPMIDEAEIWLTPLLSSGDSDFGVAPVYRPRSLEDIEKEHIQRTLTHTGGNKSQAAMILGIERSTLDRKIKGYGLK
jgi:transcriptional regulator with GAF, ATPase, and Fis domain